MSDTHDESSVVDENLPLPLVSVTGLTGRLDRLIGFIGVLLVVVAVETVVLAGLVIAVFVRFPDETAENDRQRGCRALLEAEFDQTQAEAFSASAADPPRPLIAIAAVNRGDVIAKARTIWERHPDRPCPDIPIK